MRLRHVVLIALLSCFFPGSAQAGRVFGDIKLDGKPLPAGVPVKIARIVTEEGKSKAVLADSSATDQYGSYKLTVKDAGKCVLTIVYEKQAATLEVFSYKEAIRYDLILEKKDGKLTARRK